MLLSSRWWYSLNPMRITPLLTILLLLILPLPALPSAQGGGITGYRAVFQRCTDGSGTELYAIRRFSRDSAEWVLLVDPQTFVTSVRKGSAVRPAPGADRPDTPPFDAALARTTAPPYRLQNHGATRASRPVQGEFLTVDLCPSIRPFEQGMFEALERLPQHAAGPVPVAVAITGAWLRKHPAELSWLGEQVAGRHLEITWVNHSLTHPYDPKVPLNKTFLLTPGTDFQREVLETEQLLLENGLTPSAFFRFPGLVADGTLLEKLRELSLIPLGADAWLAKGEAPTSGSFILVHGNGNEPAGIRKLMPLLQHHDLRLLPLRQAFAPAAP